MAAHHVALSVREDFSPALRAAHACAAIALSANGRSTHEDGWHFAVDRSLLDDVVRETAGNLAMQHAHDARAAAACGSISGPSDMTLIVAVLAAIVTVVFAIVVLKPQHRQRKVKSTRAEALAAIAALPEERPHAHKVFAVPQKRMLRRSGRGKRPSHPCGCEVGCFR